jgi:putative FmdB family regulatory protein
MPTYSYICNQCSSDFELFFYIKNYEEKPKCPSCNSKETNRNYTKDALTQNCSVKKSDSELKTIGDLAKRNSDRMSEDEKSHLYLKHNAYKFDGTEKELPKGMSRIKKPPKPKWTLNGNVKSKRKPKNG